MKWFLACIPMAWISTATSLLIYRLLFLSPWLSPNCSDLGLKEKLNHKDRTTIVCLVWPLRSPLLFPTPNALVSTSAWYLQPQTHLPNPPLSLFSPSVHTWMFLGPTDSTCFKLKSCFPTGYPHFCTNQPSPTHRNMTSECQISKSSYSCFAVCPVSTFPSLLTWLGSRTPCSGCGETDQGTAVFRPTSLSQALGHQFLKHRCWCFAQ